MKKLILLSFVVLLFIGCATNKATINTYVDPNFRQGEIQEIAVFPIRNTRLAPSESQQINRKISQAIKRENPSVEIMSSTEASRILNDNGLSDDWAQFLDDYATSGIPNSNILTDIGNTLEIDAILQGEIVNIFQEDGQYGGNKGTTRVTVRFSMLDTNQGNLVWESSSDGVRKTATTVESAPPIIEAVNLAIDKILSSIPNL